MASNLFWKYPNISYNVITMLVRRFPQFYSTYRHKSVVKVEAPLTDSLDDFTSRLIQKNLSRWEEMKQRHKAIKTNSVRQVPVNNEREKNESILNDIDANLQNAIDSCNYSDLVHVLEQCVDHDKCPSTALILSVLPIIAQNGDKATVSQMSELCSRHEPTFTRINADFHHYLAEAIWVRGDVMKSLELFEEVYRSNVYMRRTIRLMLRHLLSDLIANRSEAVLVKIQGLCERLVLEFRDVYLMTSLWQMCFLSEWYADHCIALELLEKYEMLREAAVARIPYVVVASLRNHRTEVVYRLLEVLLKYEMKEQSSNVVVSLLDYQIRCFNFDTCTEILHWAAENDIDLPDGNQNMLLINMLINEKMKAVAGDKKKIPKYELKF